MDMPKFPPPAEVNLTIQQLAGLSSIVMESGQASSKDKPKAIAKLWGALVKRCGSQATDIYNAVIKQPSAKESLAVLTSTLAELDKQRGKPTNRLEASTINGMGSENTPHAKSENKTMNDQVNNTGEASDDLTPEQRAAADSAIADGSTTILPVAKAKRQNVYAGLKLVYVHEKDGVLLGNPRKPGSFGDKSLGLIIATPGITTEDFLKTGGRLNDLKWDIDHKFVKALDKEAPLPEFKPFVAPVAEVAAPAEVAATAGVELTDEAAGDDTAAE